MINNRPLSQVPIAGRQLAAGNYFTAFPATTSVSALTANRLYLNPLPITTDTIIRSLGIDVTVAVANSNIYLGIYSWPRGEFVQAELLASTAILSTASTGFKEGTLNLHLKQGVYLAALVASHAITVRGAGSAAAIGQRFFWLGGPSATAEVYSGYQAYTFAALPATLGTITLVATTPLQIVFKT